MDKLSPTTSEIARKNERAILRALSERGKQQELAETLGVSDSTISRWKDGDLEKFSNLLAACKLKVVATDRVCVREDEYKTMTRITSRALSNEKMANELLFDDPE
jgi:transcriptional regulator with XRE-family HTH domain